MGSLMGREAGPTRCWCGCHGRVEWGVVRSAAAPTAARSSLSFPNPGLCAWFALGWPTLPRLTAWRQKGQDVDQYWDLGSNLSALFLFTCICPLWCLSLPELRRLWPSSDSQLAQPKIKLWDASPLWSCIPDGTPTPHLPPRAHLSNLITWKI